MPRHHAVSRALRAARLPVLAVLALGIPAADASIAAAQRRSGDGYRYVFRIESGDGDPMRGVTHVSGGRSRIELLDETGERSSSYLLISADGRTLTAVDAEKREYSMVDADRFSRIVDGAMAAADRMMTLELDDLDVTGRRLGSGDRIAGRDTERSRLTLSYAQRIGALGFTARKRHTVDVDYWVAPGLRLPRNPMIELFSSLPMVLAQHDRDFATRLRAGRDALVGAGTPLKVVVTARERDEEGREEQSRMTIEITDVTVGAQNAELFRVPDGFRQRADFSWSAKPERR